MSERKTLETIFERMFDFTDEIHRTEMLVRELEFPLVVAVGAQSSGISSVLTRLAKVNLPFGVDTVGRFPLKIISRKSDEPRYSVSWSKVNKN